MEFASPPPLTRGSLVAVVAPSSPSLALHVYRGLHLLRQRYRVRYSRGIFSKTGYLAGDDSRRAEELRAALSDPEVGAILVTRGGYGANRIVCDLPWQSLAEHPKWIVGFSDITALHLEAQRVGVMSLHASHVNALGAPLGSASSESWFAALEEPRATKRYEGLETVAAGSAVGPVIGGNLALVHATAAAGRLSIPRGAVLFIEDIGERPYRIDRMLVTLRAAGHFDGLAAVLLGDFTDCDAGPDLVGVRDVVAEVMRPFGIPVVAGLPMGHAPQNDPLVLGAPCEVFAGSAASVTFFPGPSALPSVTG